MPDATTTASILLQIPRDGKRRYMYDIWQPLILLLITASFTAAFFTSHDPYTSAIDQDSLFFCNADGKLEENNDDYKPFWDPHLYFTINIAFGEFRFSNVKVIDAAWDAVVGRGGQFVAAVVAYRTLHRSLTLTLEDRTVLIPTVTSLYCQQIQLIPVGQLVHTMFWHWSSSDLKWRHLVHSGRVRLDAQLFICIYVLSFATLVSMMTGYRARLSGFFGYDVGEVGQLFPIKQLALPIFVIYDSSRVALPEGPLFTYKAITYPEGIRQYSDVPGTTHTEYNVSGVLANSQDFAEPYGMLIDCRWYLCHMLS
jgi:hypothetical protein